jgi:uncharacterized surface protein with fasciclin (FAS1) repeats
MNVSKLFLGLLLLSIVLISCKNNEKEEAPVVETNEITTPKRAEKKILTEEDKKVIASVLAKVMSTPELKSFASAIVTVEATDLLSKEDGPYTILAPTNTAFEAIPKDKMTPFLRPENKANFGRLVKNHIVKGSFTSFDLIQNMKGSGKVELETLGGAKLIATREGTDIIITDANGKKAKIGTKDIIGGNGIVHALDAVLNIK